MLSISKVLSVTNFRTNIGRMINDIVNGQIVAVGQDEKAVVVMPIDEYNNMKEICENQIENEYILNNKATVEAISANMAQIGTDNFKEFTLEEFDQLGEELMGEADD